MLTGQFGRQSNLLELLIEDVFLKIFITETFKSEIGSYLFNNG